MEISVKMGSNSEYIGFHIHPGSILCTRFFQNIVSILVVKIKLHLNDKTNMKTEKKNFFFYKNRRSNKNEMPMFILNTIAIVLYNLEHIAAIIQVISLMKPKRSSNILFIWLVYQEGNGYKLCIPLEFIIIGPSNCNAR